MIYFYSGTPGSGKSLHVAKDIYWKLRQPYSWVFGNFEINDSVFIKRKKNLKKGMYIVRDNLHLNPRWFMNFSLEFFKRNKKGKIIEGQALLVIDECQVLFNSRDWQAKNRNEWILFFTQHRKYGYNIILISQFDRLIDRQMRSLIEYEIKHRKLNNYKIMGKLCGLLGGGSMFVAITYWYGVKQKISSEMFNANKKYCDFYDSYKIFS